MRSIEIEAKSMEEAVEKALSELKIGREEAEVEVLEEGSKGLFGLGGKSVRVRVTVKQNDSNAKEMTEKILTLMGLPSAVILHQEENGIRLEIQNSHNGLLIGNNGQTLQALQHLVKTVAGRGNRGHIILDIEGYRARREQQLTELAAQVAEKATGAHQEVEIEPMDAADRKVIHMFLKDHPNVRTESRGDGSGRKVVVIPKGE